jgi:hypothetical protein
MAFNTNNNYSQIKAHFGGFIGSIQTHATSSLGSVNDPNFTSFQEIIPAGFLKCDGSIQNAQKYLALSKVLGVGSESKFKKLNVDLREPDEETGDLGQFQLPDLGSKVIIPSRSVGDYLSTTVGDTDEYRVGPAAEVICNEGTQLTCDFIGSFEGVPVSTNYDFKSSPKYQFETTSTEQFLDIENFQGHAHDADVGYLNYTTSHIVGGDGKDDGQDIGNSGSGNVLDVSNSNTSALSSHTHKIAKPTLYTQNFQYQHTVFPIPADNVNTVLNISTERITKLDDVVTPFIIVSYIIKI